VVRPPGAALAGDVVNELPEPSWRLILGRGLPLFAAEGLVPVAVFYALWKLVGLTPAIVVATALSLAIAWWQLRRGANGALAVASAAFIVIQTIVALATHSAEVYVARSIVVSALWGCAYFISVAIGRPLTGVLAEVWYPFPRWFQASVPYRREFGLQSIVWGVTCFLRAGAGLAVLLSAGAGAFLAFAAVTGTPVVVALIGWSLWHARRTFTRLDSVDVTPELAL
jgi:hypothetical protein